MPPAIVLYLFIPTPPAPPVIFPVIETSLPPASIENAPPPLVVTLPAIDTFPSVVNPAPV